jgi:hypothetical protein
MSSGDIDVDLENVCDMVKQSLSLTKQESVAFNGAGFNDSEMMSGEGLLPVFQKGSLAKVLLTFKIHEMANKKYQDREAMYNYM